MSESHMAEPQGVGDNPEKAAFEAAEMERQAREARGVFDQDTLARQFRRGEVTFEEMLTTIREGRVHVDYTRRPGMERDWDEIAAEPRANAFYGLRITGDIDDGQWQQVRDAQRAAAGVGGEQGRAAAAVTEEAQTPGPQAPEATPTPPKGRRRKAEDPRAQQQHYKLAFDDRIYAVVRAQRGIVEQYRTGAQDWVDAPWQWDAVYGPEHRESTAITPEEAQQLIADGQLPDLTDEDVAQLKAGLAESIAAGDD